MILDEEATLAHYGILRRSGRYPWGSGGPETASNRSFLDYVDQLKKQGLSDVEICVGMGIGRTDKDGVFHPSTTQLRAAKKVAKAQEKQHEIMQAQKLKDKGMSNVEIGKKMGRNESYIRTLLAPGAKDKADALEATSNMLKAEVKDKKFVDVGAGTELLMGVSSTKLNGAVAALKEEGYVVHSLKQAQVSTGKDTNRKILTAPGTPWKEVQQASMRGDIHLVQSYTEDRGRTWAPKKVHPPVSIHPDRVAIRYGEDGGKAADGIIYIRPGVDDLSLGSKRYAQVRVKIGDEHFLKGMAMYKDDLPDGVDILFNTPKSNTGNKFDAMKPLEKDPDLPFGSITRPLLRNAGSDDEHVVSAMNIVNEEGSWGKWSRTLSSQVLSKQSPSLARAQLDTAFERRQQELADIMALTNPTIRKKLLDTFADSTDAASVHLKAAALPRQSSHVILPLETMPAHQIYAPNYKHGEKVVLIRHPHGGTFEIPELTVNNRHPDAIRILGDAEDAVGIHHSVAERLSGADFDGDTVLVIPNNNRRVTSSPALASLKDFDPQRYKIPPHPDNPDELAFPKINERRKNIEMGVVSNLITDMTLRGASHEELARAVKHSMVVIDSYKHGLDFKQSELDHGIKALKAEYQRGPRGGASTVVSRAKAPTYRNEIKPRGHDEGGPVDKATGKLVFVETGRLKPNGEKVKKPYKTLSVTDDAHDISSGTPMETLYANHSNKLKDLANEARLNAIQTPRLKYNASAKRAYAGEVESLGAKLDIAKRNAPFERQANMIAAVTVRAKREAHPDMEADELKKVKYQALTEARNRMGANKKERQVDITPKEWEAIQAGAITDSRLDEILTNADIEKVRELATPRTPRLMTPGLTNRAKTMRESGYTRAEIADALGVSTTTLNTALKEGE